MDEDDRTTLGVSLARLAVGTVAVIVIGLGAGWLFGRTVPDRAASTIVSNLTVDAATPTVAPAGGVRCGLLAGPLSAGARAAALEAGAVIVTFDPDVVGDDGLASLDRLVADLPDILVVAPDPGLEEPVRVRTLEREMVLESVRPELLAAFARGHAPPASPPPCPPGR